MASIPFNRDLSFEYGRADQVSPLVRRVIAPNPGPFTFHGTGTYILGRGQVAVIDPGPLVDSHVEALLETLKGETVTHILVTHTHIDHSPAAAPLKQATGAPTYAFGPHGSGKADDGFEVEEGGDRSFVPDRIIRDGDVIEGDGWSVECVHTPGHTSNHICFQLREEKALFCGDHVMGWSTTVISPPDGDMTDYLASLERLLQRDDEIYWPTHGGPIRDPKPFVRAYIGHRHERERQIEACLREGLATVRAMVPRMYAKDIPESMFPAAARSVLATVIHMHRLQRIAVDGEIGIDSPLALL